uniref:Uncharacterized protein n=1 Tax=Siphoviridae sp. ct2QJ10 TaxID=2825315 RepID=A0A8S5P9H1_9CAUD|nr:MAG TPA: hypothetical protein [Siphoviridae sp. ct2QJ10]
MFRICLLQFTLYHTSSLTNSTHFMTFPVHLLTFPVCQVTLSDIL